ncbi:hypothetical protein [Puia sp.]|jgi:hypothetical protein|uniref:hypothetical protein n=1 Tax=Puia sp. TaxID=2045100 RepID=UPI002F414202
MTKQEEQRIMESFRNAYSPFPAGTLVAMEPPYPDFVLTVEGNRRIGIELTEVFHSEAKKEYSSTKDKVTDKLVEVLKVRLSYPFTINVFPDPNRTIRKAEMNEVIKQLSDIVVNEFGDLPNDAWGEVEHIDYDLSTMEPGPLKHVLDQGYRNLPSGIGRIRIHRYDRLNESRNSHSEGGIVPSLTLEYIAPIVLNKEEKMAKQPVLEENWLLIREGNYYTGSFDDVRIPLPLSSSFTKVFLFRTSTGEVIELKG